MIHRIASRSIGSLRGSYKPFQRSLLATSSHISIRPGNIRLSVSSYSTAPPAPPTPPPQTTTPDAQPPTQPQTTTPTEQKHKILNKENLKVQGGRLRTFIRKYGVIGVTTYFGMYGLTLAGVYGLVSSGVIMAADAISLFKAIHLDKIIDVDSLNPKAGNFAVAWILTKFTEPIRFALTIAVTPSIYRFITGRRARLEEEEDDDHDGKDKKKDDDDDSKDKKKDKD